MRQKIVAGNWKMNGQLQQIEQLTKELAASAQGHSEVVIMPPAVYIPQVSQLLSEHWIKLGAQNVFPKDFGAFTGEVSASMLEEFNCRYVLVGHSERREYFGEDDIFIAKKFHHVKVHGMIPVLCVGETLLEREEGRAEQIIASQLLAVSKGNEQCFAGSVVAYEPVWAIGTGKTASPEQVQEMHQYIRSLVATINKGDAQNLSIIYGGSVNEHNARALFSMPDIDGGLVGGASLNAKQFLDIVTCIN